RIRIYSINRTKPVTAKRLDILESKGLSIFLLTRPLKMELVSDDYLEKIKRRQGHDPIE
ncbi:hypothetical protein K504DRAFT_369307, partial [Pleomassaria siparia CBS 279.74]